MRMFNQEDTNKTTEYYIKEMEAHKAAIKSQWKIFFRTGVFTVIAFISIVTLTMAWFAINKEVNGKGMIVNANDKGEQVLNEYTVYTRKGNVYSKTDSLAEIKMQTYDSVFGENEDMSIYIRIPVSGKNIDGKQAMDFSITRENPAVTSVGSSTEIFDENGYIANATLQDGDIDLEEGKIANLISNIAGFRFALIPELNDVDSAEEIYKGAKKYFGNPFDEGSIPVISFVDREDDNRLIKKKNEITWNLVENYGEDKLTDEDILYLYVEVFYDKYLISDYIKDHGENFEVGKLGVTKLLAFVGDLKVLEVSAKTVENEQK